MFCVSVIRTEETGGGGGGGGGGGTKQCIYTKSHSLIIRNKTMETSDACLCWTLPSPPDTFDILTTASLLKTNGRGGVGHLILHPMGELF